MWRAFLGLVKKEFIQVFRDPIMLKIIFIAPIIQIVLLGYAVNVDVKELDLDVYDLDRSVLSREFVNSMGAGEYFIPIGVSNPIEQVENRFKLGTSEMALIIPLDFSELLTKQDSVVVGLIADGSNANSAAIGLGYAAQIAREFSFRINNIKQPIEVRRQVLYNPEAKSVYYMVPGIVATILTMITIMLTSMAIVRERENDTLEQLLVTPMSGHTLLLGKLVPFAILGMMEITIGLTLGVWWFEVPFVGSPLLLMAMALLYLLTTLGLGLLFSTLTTTQQQAMFFAWFFSIFAILTSGFFTPISNMPSWMQYVTYINPMRFFMNIIRAIMMKGAGITDLLDDIAPLIIFGTVIFSGAVLRFRKRTA